MPFNPQVFDIGGGLEQGMIAGGAGLARGIERMTDRQQQLDDEERKQAKATKAARTLLVASGIMTPDKAETLSGAEATGYLEGHIIKRKDEERKAEDAFRLYQQKSADTFHATTLQNQAARDKAEADYRAQSLNEHTLSRLDAADARVAELNLRRTEGQRNYDLAFKKFDQDKVHYVPNQFEPDKTFALVYKDGKLQRLNPEGDASLNRPGENPDALNLGKRPASAAAPVPFPEALRDTDSIKRLSEDIAEQDRIMAEATENPRVRTMQSGGVGFMSSFTPTVAPKYATQTDRRAAYALAWQRKQELQKQLDALSKRP